MFQLVSIVRRALFTHLSSKILTFCFFVSSTLKKLELSFACSIKINSYTIFRAKFIHSSILSISNLQLNPYLGETFKTNMAGQQSFIHMECYEFMTTFQGYLLEKNQTANKDISCSIILVLLQYGKVVILVVSKILETGYYFSLWDFAGDEAFFSELFSICLHRRGVPAFWSSLRSSSEHSPKSLLPSSAIEYKSKRPCLLVPEVNDVTQPVFT